MLGAHQAPSTAVCISSHCRDCNVGHRSQTDLEEKVHEEAHAMLPDFMMPLVSPYTLAAFYFEIIECFRKVLIVGIPVFFYPGSIEQARRARCMSGWSPLPNVAPPAEPAAVGWYDSLHPRITCD